MNRRLSVFATLAPIALSCLAAVACGDSAWSSDDSQSPGPASSTSPSGSSTAPGEPIPSTIDPGSVTRSAASHACTKSPSAATTQVGDGGFLNALPPGQKGPPATIYKTSAIKGAVPTNDWWSSIAWEPFSQALFAHPLSAKAAAAGLEIGYPRIGSGEKVITGGHVADITVGLEGELFTESRLDGYSDWTVSMLFANGGGKLRVTVGHGLPYAYFTFSGKSPKLSFKDTPTVWSGDAKSSVIGVTTQGQHFAIFAPTGSTFAGLGSASWTLDAKGKDYLSIAVLPNADAAMLETYRKHAYAFVTGTRAEWAYDEAKSQVVTKYEAVTEAKEPGQTGTVFALYPHQWKSSKDATIGAYRSVRGAMKTVEGTSFSTAMRYSGILPAMPTNGAADPGVLAGHLKTLRTEPNHGAHADTYWGGKDVGRIAQIIPVAEQAGDSAMANELTAWLGARVAKNLVASDAGKTKVTDVFAYEPKWGTLIGVPASYDSDTLLQDHHFHYGYWIRAAAEVARKDPAWAKKWAPMVQLLIEDIADWDRTDPCFPYLRSFDPYAGHSWASGSGGFADGNNQESASESLHAWSGIALWGEIIGDKTLRDLGIYLFTTELAAVEQYWFNVDGDNFNAPGMQGFKKNYAAMIWGGKADYATWFSGDAEKVRGINFLPITPASLVLGRKEGYVMANLAQARTERGSSKWTSWQDVMWSYQALADAPGALALMGADAAYTPEEGESKAHTYAFLHAMSALGPIDATVTADAPLYTVFKKGQTKSYAAYNAGDSPRTVHFSDGAELVVPPRSMGKK